MSPSVRPLQFASNFGMSSGAVWAQGDLNFDGAVTQPAFNLLAGNFGQMGLGPGDRAGAYGYTTDDLLYHLLHGGHGITP